MNLFRNLFTKKNEAPTENSDGSNLNEEQFQIEREAKLKKFEDLIQSYKRKAYIPQTQKSERAFSAASKIGGYPYLRNENDWPVCPNCNINQQLFLQLDLSELPDKNDSGLVQLFYCTSEKPHCEVELEAYYPYSGAVTCRRIELTGPSSQITPNLPEVFGEKRIISWTACDDYPSMEEYDDLGIEIDDDIYDLVADGEYAATIVRDKLFGWPYWVQGVEYPKDRSTGRQMELLFQFDSEDSLPFMFGDCGVGHLTQSPDNKDELAFGWACY